MSLELFNFVQRDRSPVYLPAADETELLFKRGGAGFCSRHLASLLRFSLSLSLAPPFLSLSLFIILLKTIQFMSLCCLYSCERERFRGRSALSRRVEELNGGGRKEITGGGGGGRGEERQKREQQRANGWRQRQVTHPEEACAESGGRGGGGGEGEGRGGRQGRGRGATPPGEGGGPRRWRRHRRECSGCSAGARAKTRAGAKPDSRKRELVVDGVTRLGRPVAGARRGQPLGGGVFPASADEVETSAGLEVVPSAVRALGYPQVGRETSKQSSRQSSTECEVCLPVHSIGTLWGGARVGTSRRGLRNGRRVWPFVERATHSRREFAILRNPGEITHRTHQLISRACSCSIR